jgi:hypothetical protein
VVIWYILWLCRILFSRFGLLCQEKSGNPVSKLQEVVFADDQVQQPEKISNSDQPTSFQMKLFFRQEYFSQKKLEKLTEHLDWIR